MRAHMAGVGITVVAVLMIASGCGNDTATPAPGPAPSGVESTQTEDVEDGADAAASEHRRILVDRFAAGSLTDGRRVKVSIEVPDTSKQNGTEHWSVTAVFQAPGSWRLDFQEVDRRANTITVVVLADEPGFAYRRSSGAWIALPSQTLSDYLLSVTNESDTPEDWSIPGADMLRILLAEDAMTVLEEMYPETPVARRNENERSHIDRLHYQMFGLGASAVVLVDLNSETDLNLTVRRPGLLSPAQRQERRGKPRVVSAEREKQRTYQASIDEVTATGKLPRSLFERGRDVATAQEVALPADLHASKYRLTVVEGDRLQAEVMATLPDLSTVAGGNAKTIWTTVVRRPIPAPSDRVRTQADVAAHVARVVRQDTLDVYIASRQDKYPWHADTVAFMTAASELLSRPVEDMTAVQPVVALGRKAIEAGCEDPVVVATYARVCLLPRWEPFADFPQNEEAMTLLFTHRKKIDRSDRVPDYVKVIVWDALVWCQSRLDQGHALRRQSVDKQALGALEDAVTASDTTVGDFGVQAIICRQEGSKLWVPYLVKNDIARLKTIRSEKGAHAWYLELQAGLLHQQLYLDAEGSDRALHLAVAPAKNLRTIMQYGRESLMASHAHWPADPQAAEAMITVAMATSDLSECRYWFEEAVTAQMDSVDAYERMAKALWRSWLSTPLRIRPGVPPFGALRHARPRLLRADRHPRYPGEKHGRGLPLQPAGERGSALHERRLHARRQG